MILAPFSYLIGPPCSILSKLVKAGRPLAVYCMITHYRIALDSRKSVILSQSRRLKHVVRQLNGFVLDVS